MQKVRLPFRAPPYIVEKIDSLIEDYGGTRTFAVEYFIQKGLREFDVKDFKEALVWHEKGRAMDARTR